MYVLSYPGIAFKFPIPSKKLPSASEKELLNLLHKTEPPCLATSLVIFAGQSWNEFRNVLGKPNLLPPKKPKKKRKMGPTDDENIVEYAEIYPNEKIDLKFQSGLDISLTYGSFTVQSAITLLGPPNEVYTKSDNRLNIHSRHSHTDEIETGPLSESTATHSERANP